MTAPPVAVCRCGHAATDHPEQHAEMCMAVGCTCVSLWIAATNKQAAPVVPRLRDLIAAGKTSKRIRSQRLAARISSALDAPVAEIPCRRDPCPRTFASTQARAMHERRAHDGFNPARMHTQTGQAA